MLRESQILVNTIYREFIEEIQVVDEQKLELQEFDNLLYQMLTNGKLAQCLNSFSKYETDSIPSHYLQAFKGRQFVEIQREFTSTFNQYFNHIQETVNQDYFTASLIEAVFHYSNSEDIYKISQDIISLYYLFVLMNAANVSSQFTQSLKLACQALDDYHLGNASFKEAVQAAKDLNSLIVVQFQEKQIDHRSLTSLCKGSDIAKHCLENPDLDYNELYERLDDETMLNNTVISDMNDVNTFIMKLKKEFSKMQEENRKAIDYYLRISQIYQETYHSDRNFPMKLQNCISNVQQIKNIMDMTINTTENTLTIITKVLEDGKMIFSFQGDQCVISIKYSQGSQTLDLEKLIQLGGRAILLSHSKSKSDSENIEDRNINVEESKLVEEQINTFRQKHRDDLVNANQKQETDAEFFLKLITLSQEYQHLLTELFQNGHLEFALDYIYEENISRKESVENISYQIEELETLLTDWRILLDKLRKKYYYLCYIPNSQINDLIKYFSEPNLVNRLKVDSTMRSICDSADYHAIVSTIEPIDQELELEEKLEEFAQKLQEVISQLQIENIEMFNSQNELNDKRRSILRNGGTQFYSVLSSHDNIRAIASIFSVSKYYPKISQILFCSKKTKLYEVISFIQRAYLAPQNIQQERIFVLSNFQQLLTEIQIEAFKYMTQIKNDQVLHFDQNNPYYLFILATQDERKEYLIDEMQNIDDFSMHILNDKHIKSFFAISNSHLYLSENAGLGKSTQITNRALQNVGAENFHRIPIFGEMTKEKLIKLHQQKIQQNIGQIQKRIAIHYDLYPTLNEDVNIILFELTIFKALNNGSQIYLINGDVEYFIEISQELNKIKHEFIFQYIQDVQNLVWDENLFIIDQNPESIDQLVMRGIQVNSLDPGTAHRTLIKKYHIIPSAQSVVMSNFAILLLEQEFLNEISSPNFYVIKNFIQFAGDQLEKILKSPQFQEDPEDANDGSFYEFNRLLYAIIQSIFNFSKLLITQNEQLIRNQLLVVENRQGNFEEEKQLQFFNGNDYSIVTMNEDGTITPINRNKSDLPPSLITYYQVLINQNQYSIQIYSQRQNQLGQIEEMKENIKAIQREMESFEKLSHIEVVDKIFRICSSSLDNYNIKIAQDPSKAFNLNRIVFTADNFLKMNLIYLKLRAKQTVTIMGETGVGKTALIEYLKDVLGWEYAKLNVHEGVSEEQIIQFMQKAELVARGKVKSMNDLKGNLENIEFVPIEERKPQNLIIFFDEVNTNLNVNGLFKEILLDRMVQGVKIHDNISLISACNPYKKALISQKQNDKYTTGLKHIKQDQKSKAEKQLVYRVHPLPESQFSSTWNFGSLQEGEERVYIHKIIQDVSGSLQMNFEKRQVNYISEVVHQSQQYIRLLESKWDVSLRDVDRVRRLFIFFNSNNARTNFGQIQIDNSDQYLKRVISLTLSVCYFFRLSTKQLRNQYLEMISRIHVEQFSISKKEFERYLQEEYNRYMDCMEIPLGIGKNDSLKENVFSIITMILNKIPLFITGKPGSSKTLAMNLVLKSMKGKSSGHDFFKNLPAVMPFYYQGSVQSTSEGIMKIFERAYKTNDAQEAKRLKNQQLSQSGQNDDVIVVVIIDEIGLAEISPHNPLKVLHAYLEMFVVSFVGISNYCLDASKQNRGITLQKPEPGKEDLEQAAISLSKDINSEKSSLHKKFEESYVQKLVKFYQNYYEDDQRNFHGLRDFYQMISQICFSMKENHHRGNIMEIIIDAVKRNFGGNDIDKVLAFLIDQFPESIDSLQNNKADSRQMIKQNIQDLRARNLMIISDHLEIINLRFIEEVCNDINREFEVFYGSDFENDQEEKSIHKLIHDIMACMETGKICILMNLDNIYQAFYDMLNQNYQEINRQKYCKVAIGPDSTRCQVHPEFRCIILSNSAKVIKMDPPLLNRFEKHIYNEHDSLTHEQIAQRNKLVQWVNQIGCVEEKFYPVQMFPTLCYSQEQLKSTVTSLVVLTRKLGISDAQESFCKKELINFANNLGILRSNASQAEDRDEWRDYYLYNHPHGDLDKVIRFYTDTWKDHYLLQQLQNGYNLVVYTYSLNQKDLFSNDQKIIDKEPIILSSISSKDQLQTLLERFFGDFHRESSFQTKIIIADQSKDSQLTIQLCKSLVNKVRIKALRDAQENHKKGNIMNQQARAIPNMFIQGGKNNQQDFNLEQKFKLKNIVLVVKVKENFNSNVYFNQGWKEVFVDLINGKGNTNIHQDDHLLNQSLTDIIQNQAIFAEIIQLNLRSVMSNINYSNCKDSIWIETRVNNMSLLIQPQTSKALLEFITKIFINLLRKFEDLEDLDKFWQKIIANDVNLISTIQSFHGAAMAKFRSLLLRYLTYIIYHLETLQVMDFIIDLSLSQSKENTLESSIQDANAIRERKLEFLVKMIDEEMSGFEIKEHHFAQGNTYLISRLYTMQQYPFFNKLYSQINQQLETLLFQSYQQRNQEELVHFRELEELNEAINYYNLKISSEEKKREEQMLSFTNDGNSQDIYDEEGEEYLLKFMNIHSNHDSASLDSYSSINIQPHQSQPRRAPVTIQILKERVQIVHERINHLKASFKNIQTRTMTKLGQIVDQANQNEQIKQFQIGEIDGEQCWDNMLAQNLTESEFHLLKRLLSLTHNFDLQKCCPIRLFSIYLNGKDLNSKIVRIIESLRSTISTDYLLENMKLIISQELKNYNLEQQENLIYPEFILINAFTFALFQSLKPTATFLDNLKNQKISYEDQIKIVINDLLFLSKSKRSLHISKLIFITSFKEKVLNMIRLEIPNENGNENTIKVPLSQEQMISKLKEIWKIFESYDDPIDLIEQVSNLYSSDESNEEDPDSEEEIEEDIQEEDEEEVQPEEDEPELQEEAKASSQLNQDEVQIDTSTHKRNHNVEDQHEQEEDKDQSDEDSDADDVDESSQSFLICCFILQQIENELKTASFSKLSKLKRFMFKPLKFYAEEIESRPFIVKGLLQQIVKFIIQESGGGSIQIFLAIENNNDVDEMQDGDYLQGFQEGNQSRDSESSIIFLLKKLLNSNEYNIESQMVVLLTDVIQQEIEESKIYQFDELHSSEYFIRELFQTSLNINAPLHSRIVSIANVRQILILVANEIVISCSENRKPRQISYLQVVDQFFSSEQFNYVEPLILYLLKQIQIKASVNEVLKKLQEINNKQPQNYSWVTHLIESNQTRQQLFQKLLDVRSVIVFQKTFEDHTQKDDIERKLADVKINLPHVKYLFLQAISQQFILNRKDERSSLENYIDNSFSSEPFICAFLKRVVLRRFTELEQKYLINQKNSSIKELLNYSIVTCISLTNKNNFFSHLFRNPSKISNLFMPFNMNHQDELAYQAFKVLYDNGDGSVSTQKQFTKYICKNCKEPFFVTDCGILSDQRAPGFGTSQCSNCQAGIGVGYEENCQKIYEKNLQEDFESESQKGFIYAKDNDYISLAYPRYKLRDLDRINLFFSQIIVHLTLMSSAIVNHQNDEQSSLFESPENELVQTYKDPRNRNRLSIEDFLEQNMRSIIVYQNQIVNLLQITSDQFILLVESFFERILLNMENHQVSIDNLQTIELRRGFEKFFQAEIIQMRSAKEFNAYLRDTQPAYIQAYCEKEKILEDNLNERIKIEELEKFELSHKMPSMLRTQAILTYDKFKEYLQNQNDKDCELIKVLISKRDVILYICHFKPILDWMNFVLVQFNGKVSEDDAKKLTLKTIISNRLESKADQKRAKSLFIKFIDSWNFLSERVEKSDACDTTIKFEKMSELKSFASFCVSSSRKDKLGIYLYYMILRLAELQNDLITSVQQIHGFEFLQDRIQNPVQIQDLKDYQLIGERLDVEFIEREQKTYSSNELRYGFGKNIQYDTQKLAERLFSTLIQNKAYIEISEHAKPIDFVFENLFNPHNQYDEIQAKIPQVKYGSVYTALVQLNQSEDKQNLLLDIQTTMNYLQYVGGRPDQFLVDFMRAFKITRFIDVIGQGIQLQHILDFYEHTEQFLESHLVKKCDSHFMVDLSISQEQDLQTFLLRNQELIPTFQTILGRLIIRQLSDTSQTSISENLGKYLFGLEEQSYLFGIQHDSMPQIEALKRGLEDNFITPIRLTQAYQTYLKILQIQRDLKDKLIEEALQQVQTMRSNQEKVNRERADEENTNAHLDLKQAIGITNSAAQNTQLLSQKQAFEEADNLNDALGDFLEKNQGLKIGSSKIGEAKRKEDASKVEKKGKKASAYGNPKDLKKKTQPKKAKDMFS